MFKKVPILGSSEPLTCEECGATFNTIDALNEHRKAEREDEKFRNAGFADG
jgi:C2H2-type zinc finger